MQISTTGTIIEKLLVEGHTDTAYVAGKVHALKADLREVLHPGQEKEEALHAGLEAESDR